LRAALISARTLLWSAIESAGELRFSELWSWSVENGCYDAPLERCPCKGSGLQAADRSRSPRRAARTSGALHWRSCSIASWYDNVFTPLVKKDAVLDAVAIIGERRHVILAVVVLERMMRKLSR
jgi:hypothetical protein